MVKLKSHIVYPKKDFILIIFLALFSSAFAFEQNFIQGVELKTYENKLLEFPSFFNSSTTLVSRGASTSDSIEVFRDLAIEYSNNNNVDSAMLYIEKYIGATADLSIINDHLFSNINSTDKYLEFKEKYLPKFNFMAIIYFYAGFLGIFIFIILNIKKGVDRLGTFLISLFVLFNSLFILHLSLYVINYQYHLPQALLMTATFSFLYGPLLYFYFKRINYNYKFKLIDTLHLLPSVILFVSILPYYMMSPLEKFNILFDGKNVLQSAAYTVIIVKILSLSIYAFLILKMYRKNKKTINSKRNDTFCWQRNLLSLHIIYTIAYIIYAGGITGIVNFQPLFHLQIVVMVSVVFYVAYIAYGQPEIFKGKMKLLDPLKLFKYKKSGLTSSLSLELKENLLKLLNEDKVFLDNDLNLESLSIKLNTTRHNTSQVINEHFKMSFSELMNQYRIEEATEILKRDEYNSLSIIQVAYEVGFNNKVSFNKYFKKQLSLTPTQYIKSLRA